jgi:hypothetical protein
VVTFENMRAAVKLEMGKLYVNRGDGGSSGAARSITRSGRSILSWRPAMLKTIGQKNQWIVIESSTETPDSEVSRFRAGRLCPARGLRSISFPAGIEAAQKINAEISAKL